MTIQTKHHIAALLAVVILLLLFVICGVGGNCCAQVCKITRPDGGSGMGCVIGMGESVDEDYYYGMVATANHVVDKDWMYKIEYESGEKVMGCSVLKRDVEADIAILWALVPKTILPMEISPKPCVVGDKVLYCGKEFRRFEGEARLITGKREIYADVVEGLIAGDSGGPIMDAEGRYLGCISGGLRWCPTDGKRTWPARGNNLPATVALVNKVLRSEVLPKSTK
jgi:hypothetical protein